MSRFRLPTCRGLFAGFDTRKICTDSCEATSGCTRFCSIITQSKGNNILFAVGIPKVVTLTFESMCCFVRVQLCLWGNGTCEGFLPLWQEIPSYALHLLFCRGYVVHPFPCPPYPPCGSAGKVWTCYTYSRCSILSRFCWCGRNSICRRTPWPLRSWFLHWTPSKALRSPRLLSSSTNTSAGGLYICIAGLECYSRICVKVPIQVQMMMIIYFSLVSLLQ